LGFSSPYLFNFCYDLNLVPLSLSLDPLILDLKLLDPEDERLQVPLHLPVLFLKHLALLNEPHLLIHRLQVKHLQLLQQRHVQLTITFVYLRDRGRTVIQDVDTRLYYTLHFLELFLENADFHDHQVGSKLHEAGSLQVAINVETEVSLLLQL
jgi:hypothetical protein